MSFFTFFKKTDTRAQKMQEFEKLLTQTTRWKYRGIHGSYLDADYGAAFLEDITLDKSKTLTLDDLKAVGRILQSQQKTYSKEEIQALGQKAGFNAWEAFDWEKEYFESIRNITHLVRPD